MTAGVVSYFLRFLKLGEVGLKGLQLTLQKRDLLRPKDILHLATLGLVLDKFLSKVINLLGQALVSHIQIVQVLQLFLLVGICVFFELELQFELAYLKLGLLELDFYRLQLLGSVESFGSELF